MKVEIPVEAMTVPEKLYAMELLWNDLCKVAPDEAVPAWHADVLAAREARLAAGTEKVLDWEEAKVGLHRLMDESKNS